MFYLIIFLLLLSGLTVYFRIADHFNIIDKPNSRSSHTSVTIRGGGIVFPLAMVLYGIFFHGVSSALLGGMLLISLVSFWDDVRSLPNKVRILFHLLAVSALLWSVGAFYWPAWLIAVAYVLIIGSINAYNFMDGINGITGVYSLVILSALAYINHEVLSFTDQAFILCPIVACVVFLFFNFRKKAKCFAGDVGSVGIGFWVISLILMLIIQSDSLKYILFLAVYGVDAVLTIVHRLILKQNIFEAHRLHFYQILANERKVNHLVVSSVYGFTQLAINLFIIYTDLNFWLTALFVLVPLALVYILLKSRMMSRPVLV